ncbi:CaiB/BaiF CoA transferase family protein [Microvirga sp. M2]|uniref:CaiB/BaiF CoA transferase family protein n=1 Tax=Microvirga sp. M2 TaxID=3073270 RepID=UPI0039C0DD2F
MSATPLSGIRVLDLTSVVVGPACTVRLANYGADVVKVESFEGDQMRALGGPSPTGEHSGSYLHFNGGKRSICLNLKQPAARRIVSRLLDVADVFVSNMRPDALARLGLDADCLRDEHPRLVHCTITGFGPGGPYRGRAAYDSALQGASGIAGLFNRRDGDPKYVPLLICDHVVGEIAAGAILSALFERERTGRGTKLEIPMYETMAAFVLQEHLGPKTFEPALGAVGDSRVLNPDNRPLQTADGWISLTANTDAQTRAFLKAIGREDAIDDPRFRTTADRYRHVGEWFALRNDALKARTTAEWLELFAAYDVPAMPCHTLETLLDDPHLTAVGILGDMVHPTEGRIRGIRPTILNDDAVAPAGRAARPIGWDTRSVLSELGFSAGDIQEFLKAGVARVYEPAGGAAGMVS